MDQRLTIIDYLLTIISDYWRLLTIINGKQLPINDGNTGLIKCDSNNWIDSLVSSF